MEIKKKENNPSIKQFSINIECKDYITAFEFKVLIHSELLVG